MRCETLPNRQDLTGVVPFKAKKTILPNFGAPKIGFNLLKYNSTRFKN